MKLPSQESSRVRKGLYLETFGVTSKEVGNPWGNSLNGWGRDIRGSQTRLMVPIKADQSIPCIPPDARQHTVTPVGAHEGVSHLLLPSPQLPA